jgi:hypothetical protein
MENNNKEIPKHTMKNKKESDMQSKRKGPIWLENYRDCFTFKTKPVTELFIERFFSDVVKEARNNEEVLTMEDLFLNKGVPSVTYYGWVKRYPLAKEANDFAKAIIGNRREKGALKKKFDVGMIMFSMPMYSDRWKESFEWKSRLKEKEHKTSGIQVVYVPTFEDLYKTQPKKKCGSHSQA